MDVQGLLDNRFAALSELDMRENGLAAIRTLHGRRNDDFAALELSLSSWANALINVLLVEGEIPELASWRNALQLEARRAPKNGTIRHVHLHVLQFWQWMVQAGFAVQLRSMSTGPSESTRDGDGKLMQGEPLLSTWIITPLGSRRLDSEHPCRPGAMDRLWKEFGGELADPLSRLEDARACYDHGLLRPAVVMLGVGFEELLVSLHTRLNPDERVDSAKKRLRKVRGAIEQHPKSWELRDGALTALLAADRIREARNVAGHQAGAECDPLEVDELLTYGLLAFPRLAAYRSPDS